MTVKLDCGNKTSPKKSGVFCLKVGSFYAQPCEETGKRLRFFPVPAICEPMPTAVGHILLRIQPSRRLIRCLTRAPHPSGCCDLTTEKE